MEMKYWLVFKRGMKNSLFAYFTFLLDLFWDSIRRCIRI